MSIYDERISDREILQLQKENDILKEDNEELKIENELQEEEIEKLNMSVAFWEEKCDHRKERNKELKEENEKLEEEIEELKEECERWEAEADRTSELECIAWIDFYGEKEVIDDIKAYRFREDILAMKKENEKLKEENKELKEEIKEIRQIEKRCDRYVKKTLEENEKLKEEAEKREDWIHYIIKCLGVYDEWEGNPNADPEKIEDADALAERVVEEIKTLKIDLKNSEDKVCELTHENRELGEPLESIPLKLLFNEISDRGVLEDGEAEELYSNYMIEKEMKEPKTEEVKAFCSQCDWEGKCLVGKSKAKELEDLKECAEIGENDFCGCNYESEDEQDNK